jgi:hypothetical protein
MNLSDIYISRGIPANRITVGMQLIILKQERCANGTYIEPGTIGTVIESRRCGSCDEPRCIPAKRILCHGYILSVRTAEDKTAHSCYFKFCTPEGIPIVFEEVDKYEPD